MVHSIVQHLTHKGHDSASVSLSQVWIQDDEYGHSMCERVFLLGRDGIRAFDGRQNHSDAESLRGE